MILLQLFSYFISTTSSKVHVSLRSKPAVVTNIKLLKQGW